MRRRDDRGAVDMRLAGAADGVGCAHGDRGELAGEDQREKRRVEVEAALLRDVCGRQASTHRVLLPRGKLKGAMAARCMSRDAA